MVRKGVTHESGPMCLKLTNDVACPSHLSALPSDTLLQTNLEHDPI